MDATFDIEQYYPPIDIVQEIKPPHEIGAKFGDLCNKNPIQAMAALKSFTDQHNDPYYLGKLIAFTKGIEPEKRTECLFNSAVAPETVFFFFFTALNTEFTTIIDFAIIHFNLIGLPNNASQLKIIINALSDAYLSKNPNCRLSNYEVKRIILAYILFTTNFNTKNPVEPDKFKLLFKNLAFPEENIRVLYNSLLNRWKVIHLTCGVYDSPVDVKLTSTITTKRSMFKLVKSIILKLDGYWLEIYNDTKAEKAKNRFLLYDVIATTKRNPDENVLEFGRPGKETMIIGPHKYYDEGKYTITCDQFDLLQKWCDTINWVSFQCTVQSLMNPEIETGNVSNLIL